VQRRILPTALIAFILLSFFTWNCTKLDTTDIGSDLIPAVDNVNTFDTVLNINATQGIFNDSTLIYRTEDHALGRINNDPLFGTTTANVFMQLKPTFYPYYLGNAGDTLFTHGAGLDSVVLCINYKGFWGDSSIPIRLEVREVNDVIFRDSVALAKKLDYAPNTGALLGSADVDVRRLGDTVKYANKRDYSINQIRIKLNPSDPTHGWPEQLYTRDTLTGHAFLNDSLFRQFYNGLAVLATGSGNGLIYTNLADTSTKLEIHFRRKNNGKMDTLFQSLKLNPATNITTNAPSNTVNNIVRNRAGYPISFPSGDELFLQTQPGTYVDLKIPGLSTLSNRVIHRAEIIVEQIYTGSSLDGMLTPPNFLYLDLKDTSVVPGTPKWKPVYFDLSPNIRYDPDFKSGFPYFPSNGVDFLYFGGFRREKKDLAQNPIQYYTFNISRYVQHIVTDHYHNYDLRLFAPYSFSYPQYGGVSIPYSNNIAQGRVRIGSGTNTNSKLRLRIIYSKI